MSDAVTIPEEYIPIVDGLLWKKILQEGSGDSPTKKSNVNGNNTQTFEMHHTCGYVMYLK